MRWRSSNRYPREWGYIYRIREWNQTRWRKDREPFLRDNYVAGFILLVGVLAIIAAFIVLLRVTGEGRY